MGSGDHCALTPEQPLGSGQTLGSEGGTSRQRKWPGLCGPGGRGRHRGAQGAQPAAQAHRLPCMPATHAHCGAGPSPQALPGQPGPPGTRRPQSMAGTSGTHAAEGARGTPLGTAAAGLARQAPWPLRLPAPAALPAVPVTGREDKKRVPEPGWLWEEHFTAQYQQHL